MMRNSYSIVAGRTVGEARSQGKGWSSGLYWSLRLGIAWAFIALAGWGACSSMLGH
jgi:hypothetical protein